MPNEQNSDNWNMSQERTFIEGLVGQRFNFFLVFFSLVLNGYVNAKTQFQLKVILTIGAVVCSMIAHTLALAHFKLNRILDELPREHPFHKIADKVHGWSGKGWIGYVIPIACSATLMLGAILAWCGCLQVANS